MIQSTHADLAQSPKLDPSYSQQGFIGSRLVTTNPRPSTITASRPLPNPLMGHAQIPRDISQNHTIPSAQHTQQVVYTVFQQSNNVLSPDQQKPKRPPPPPLPTNSSSSIASSDSSQSSHRAQSQFATNSHTTDAHVIQEKAEPQSHEELQANITTLPSTTQSSAFTSILDMEVTKDNYNDFFQLVCQELTGSNLQPITMDQTTDHSGQILRSLENLKSKHASGDKKQALQEHEAFVLSLALSKFKPLLKINHEKAQTFIYELDALGNAMYDLQNTSLKRQTMTQTKTVNTNSYSKDTKLQQQSISINRLKKSEIPQKTIQDFLLTCQSKATSTLEASEAFTAFHTILTSDKTMERPKKEAAQALLAIVKRNIYQQPITPLLSESLLLVLQDIATGLSNKVIAQEVQKEAMQYLLHILSSSEHVPDSCQIFLKKMIVSDLATLEQKIQAKFLLLSCGLKQTGQRLDSSATKEEFLTLYQHYTSIGINMKPVANTFLTLTNGQKPSPPATKPKRVFPTHTPPEPPTRIPSTNTTIPTSQDFDDLLFMCTHGDKDSILTQIEIFQGILQSEHATVEHKTSTAHLFLQRLSENPSLIDQANTMQILTNIAQEAEDKVGKDQKTAAANLFLQIVQQNPGITKIDASVVPALVSLASKAIGSPQQQQALQLLLTTIPKSIEIIQQYPILLKEIQNIAQATQQSPQSMQAAQWLQNNIPG